MPHALMLAGIGKLLVRRWELQECSARISRKCARTRLLKSVAMLATPRGSDALVTTTMIDAAPGPEHQNLGKISPSRATV